MNNAFKTIHSGEPGPRISAAEHKARRERFLAKLAPNSVAVIVANPERTRSNDTEYKYRQSSDVLYLTAFPEPEAVIAVMGPRARDLLRRVSDAHLANESFPFGTAREIEIGMATARAHRITYVGELGWELYVPTEMARHAFEAILEAGTAHELRLCGLHALDSCRIEKAYRHAGHDVTGEDHVLEAGLGFAVNRCWRVPGGLGLDGRRRLRFSRRGHGRSELQRRNTVDRRLRRHRRVEKLV